MTGAVRSQGRSNEDTSALIEAVNKTGKAFLITTDLAGQTVARIACGGFMTQVASGIPVEIYGKPCWLQCSRPPLAEYAWYLNNAGQPHHQCLDLSHCAVHCLEGDPNAD